MKRLIATFYRSTFYIFKVNIHTSSYVSIETLYPVRYIKADFFSDDVDFKHANSTPLLKEFFHNIIDAYDSFCESDAKVSSFLNYLSENEYNGSSRMLGKIVDKYISANYHQVDLKFFSKITKRKFRNTHINFAKYRTVPFENIYEKLEEVKILESCQKIILETNIRDVIFINYTEDLYSGTDCSMQLNLWQGDYGCERVLQEFFVCYYTQPIYQGQKPFKLPYFEERFNAFPSHQKLGLFVTCSKQKELYLYNQQLIKYWMNRY